MAVDFTQPEPLVRRHKTMRDLVLLDVLLTAAENVPEEILKKKIRWRKGTYNGDMLWAWQVAFYAGDKQQVDFVLGRGLRSKGTAEHLDLAIRLRNDLVCALHKKVR